LKVKSKQGIKEAEPDPSWCGPFENIYGSGTRRGVNNERSSDRKVQVGGGKSKGVATEIHYKVRFFQKRKWQKKLKRLAPTVNSFGKSGVPIEEY